MMKPMNYELVKKELDERLFKVVETEDCLQKSAVKMANFIFTNSHSIAVGETELPITVGWEFKVRDSHYQVVMEIRKVEE